MENDAGLGLHRGNTELGNENNGDVEDESNETILCGESEVMLQHQKTKASYWHKISCIGTIW